MQASLLKVLPVSTNFCCLESSQSCVYPTSVNCYPDAKSIFQTFSKSRLNTFKCHFFITFLELSRNNLISNKSSLLSQS